MATPKPKYVKRTTPLPKGARSKVSQASRLRTKGLVKDSRTGALYSTRTGMLAGPNATRKAAPAQSGFNPGQAVKDFFGNVAPQDNLFKQIGTKIKNAGK